MPGPDDYPPTLTPRQVAQGRVFDSRETLIRLAHAYACGTATLAELGQAAIDLHIESTNMADVIVLDACERNKNRGKR